MGFSLELYDLDPVSGAYTRKDIIGQFPSLQFVEAKNTSGAARFELSGFSPKATDANLIRYRTIVAIKYNSTIIWSGFISRLRPTFSDVTYSWTLELIQYFGRLERRITGVSDIYNQVGQGAIAWDLIDNAQGQANGQLGITMGAVDNSVLRDRTYNSYIIGEAIENLSQVMDGFDFELLPVVDSNGVLTSHIFNTYASVGANRTDLPPLTLGGSVVSFTAFTNQDITNYTIFKGAGTGSAPLIAADQDSGSQSTYSLLESAYLREDVSDATTLLSWAQRTVVDLKDNQYLFDLNLKPGSNLDPFAFRIGDTLRLNLTTPEMTKTFVGDCEVMAKEFLVDPQGVLFCSIKVKYTE